MKNNFTQSEAKTLVEKHSRTHAQPKGKSLLAFVQKIVDIMAFLFESKDEKKKTKTKNTNSFGLHSAVSIEDKILQEYFIDEQNKHLHASVNNQESIVNEPLIKTDSIVKEYRLGSRFDQNLKQWVSVFSPPIRIYNEEDDKQSKNSTYRGLATTIMLVLFSILGVVAQTSVDLSLRKSIDNSSPTLNGTVKYTLWLKNSGPSTASTIVVQDNFPIGGATLTSHNGGANFNYTPGTGIGLWSVASLASGDSVHLEIIANVIERGVFFNISEVKSIGIGQQDIDSTPNNSILSEDDMAASCFSVPLIWYPGEEYNVSVPAPFKYGKTIKWFRGVTEITGATTQAVVNADSSLTIKAPGSYNFTTNVSTCPAQGCCGIQVIEGPYGSISDYVWIDSNNDGIQGTTALEPPVAGVKVYLLDNAAGTKLDSTFTDALGKYVFDSLLSGIYKLKFVLPAGNEATGKLLGGDITKDSNINPDGTTDAITIDVTQTLGLITRNNTTIDAGLKPTSTGSIGDYVWKDTNNNGLNDDGQIGVSGVIVELYASDGIGLPIGSVLKKDTTDNNGKYLFTGLSEGNYVVKVITSTLPAGAQITSKQDVGSDETIDSDFNSSTGLSDKVLINLSDIAKKDILTVDAGLYTVPTPITPVTIADLSVNKTVSNSTPNQGDLITYYIDVKNGGPAIATNVEVNDIVPTGLQVVSATGGDLMDIAGNTVIAKINQIAVGQSTTFQIVAKVTASTGSIKNWTQITKSDQKDSNSTPNNGIDKQEDDDDDADINIKQSSCNPTTPLIACSNPYICLGESVSIEAIGCNGTIVWSDGQTGNSVKVTPNVTSTYTAQCKINDNCISAKSNSVTVVVNVIAAPLISSNSTTNIICGSGKITLTSNNCTGTITWSTGATTASIEVSPSNTTSYTAVCKKGDCISGKSNSVTVTIGSPSNPPTIATNKSTICVGQAAVLTASNCSGTVVWSNGSTGTSISLTPTATGIYSAVCKVGECSSATSSTVTITVAPTETPTITANNESICVGESAILKVTGCNGNLLWSTGATTSTITVTPTITTTYDVKCGTGECVGKATKSITVTPKPTAPIVTCGKERICAGESLTFTAHGCEGSVTWSSGATGSTMIVTPTVTTSYSAICTVNGCTSEPSKSSTIEVINQTPPTITATSESVCSGGTVTLTAANCTGTVLWNTGATTFAITATPTIVTTYTVKCIIEDCEKSTSKTITIGGGTAPVAPIISTNQSTLCGNDKAILTANGCENGTIKWNTGATSSTISAGTGNYTATCNNSCGESAKSSEIIITVGTIPAVPVITTTTKTLCGNNTANLTASGCIGTIKWSTGATGSTISVATGTYSAICSNSCGDSGTSNSIILTNTTVPTPSITASKNGICIGETVTMKVSNCTGTLTWSTGATGSTITVTPTETKTYEVTCLVEDCSNKGTNTITVTPKPATPIVTCGKERICLGESLTFTAHGCEGVVTWNTGATGSTIIFTPTVSTTYNATCTINGCTSEPSLHGAITIITPEPSIYATNETLCGGGSVTLTASNCAGTVLWNTGATTAAITVTPTLTTTYNVKCLVDGCEGSASKIITVGGQQPSAPTIKSNKENVCGNEIATLTASDCVGSVKWSTGGVGLTIAVGTGTYSAICTNGCGESAKSNVITILSGGGTAPTLSASITAICEPGNVTLSATGCTGTLVWSNGQTGSSFTINVATTTTFSATCKAGACESSKSNEITVTVGKPNKPSISSDKTTICAGDAVVLTAVGCTGTTVWSNGLTGSPITVNPANTTNYTAVCKLPQGGCTSEQSDKVTVNVISKAESPIISCSASRICQGDTLTLNALGCAGTVVWSSGQTTTSISIHPTVTTVYTAICKVGSCESAPSAAATINVGNPLAPIINCKNTQVCSGTSTQIEAAGCAGTVKWSDGQVGAVITVSPTILTSYWAICDGGKCQSEKSNIITVQVTGSGLTKPTVKDLINTCPFTTVDLTTGVTSKVSSQGGVFVFRTGTTPGSPAVSNASAVGTGTYYVFEKAGNGCYSDAGKINVNITTCVPVNPSCVNNPATVKAGKDSTVCMSEDFFTLKGQIGGSASSAKWTTTDGTGTFENALSLSTKYYYTKEDLIKGNISFILTTNDPDDNGPCVAAKDTFKIILKGVTTTPSIVSNKSPNICFGDSVVLTVNEAGIYKWSNGATTKSITVKTPGRYSVKLLSQEGCASLSSNEVVVVLGNAIAAPTVTAMAKNTCPATVVNLSTAVKSAPQTQGGVFEFHTGNKSDSPGLANTTAVGAGTYYVFEKSTIGCYSSGAPIMVMIDQCTPDNPSDTTQTELSIEIIGSRVELKVGDPVTYTIKVKNNSSKTATNVHIVNVLPKGLEITSSTPGFTAFGKDSLLSVIGSLAGGATKTYTYESKTTKAGKIINIAKITKLDQIDPITSNNISQWTVECKTCQETCVGLALSADTTRQANGSYNITFRALIEACGNVKLEGVKISENLATMFPAPTTYTIVQKPTAGVGSKLITNDSFNGSTDLSLTIPEGSVVEPGIIDTVKFVINIVPNGKEGPFTTNAIAEAIGNTAFGIPQDVSDVSNNGKFVDKASAEPTVVKLYKSPSIGLAKIVLDTTKHANGSYDVTYQLLVKNNGSLVLNDVIVRDTLSKVFKAPATFTAVGVPTKNTGSQLAINNAFNGSTDTRLTLTGSTIAVGKTDTLKFTVNVQPDTVKLFANTAVASGSGTLTNGTKENVTDLSNAGLNPDAPGSNPTNLVLGSDAGNSIEIPCIGIALYVKDTLKQADGSYNITYNAIIKNCGNLNLSNIQICDTLSKTFNLPAIATIVKKPTLSVGSQLKTDNDYDGVNNTCMLLSDSQIAPNKIDTISWIINVKLNGNKGPFRNTVIVTAKTPSGKIISDASNAGINPNADGNAPTVINFNNLPEAIIGISKSASEPKLVNGTTNTYDVTFTFKVKNYGKVVFTGVQIQDNLSVAFGDSVKIDSVNVKADTGFTVNKSYTGRGSLINLLVDSLSTLAVDSERSVTLFTRLTTTSNKVNFENQALAIGKYPSNKSTDDLSTNGSDPDFSAGGEAQKNNDGDPRNNWLPTPVKLGTIEPTVFSTTLGIAKAATLDSVKNADDTYNLTYTVIVKNFSTHKLTNVQLSDSLGQVFADSAEFVLVGKPTLNKNSKLKIDSTFNGRTVTTMLIADSSSLAVGTSDTLIFKLRLLSTKQGDAIYANTITGTAKDSTTNVKDKSYAGLNPDPDGDKNPGNNNEPTIITIKGKTTVLDSLAIIPDGFSPNGDGTGDMFVITGVNKTDRLAEIYIYNRWGQLIYQNTDFGKEEGWNGVATNGILVGSKGAGVPDGTYYYYVKAEGLWGDKPKIGFLTLVR
ncbi:SdrD B-like domain-containing protein [Emticicia sp. SJ17W-69]|uniref:SdrD B-like domain-containing protein n=1 Tax=Emticicia sp. SJ17W-69 TaxID=3421657 RepID=UPI003EBD2662